MAMHPTRRDFALSVLGARAASPAPRRPVFPGAAWEEAPPDSLGMDGAPLDEIASALGGRGCVVRDGRVVKAWGSQSETGDWLSSAKPVLSTLLFFAIEEGRVGGVGTPVVEFGWKLAPKDRPMTFAHLANMVSGYARPEPPGAAWAYNDYAIQLYQKTLFDRVFGDDPKAAAMHPRRLGSLRFEDGLEFSGGRRRLFASVRDFARIAWFWLNRGGWDGRQVLPRRYFDRYQRPQVPPSLRHTAPAETDDYLAIGTFGGGSDHFTEYGAGIYGFNWWFNRTGRLHPRRVTWPDAPPDAFMSIGAGGNCSVIVPSLRAVLVCARGNWGKLEPGNPDSPANRSIRLLASACGDRPRPGF
jgi:hypothetical protein